ncbi:MAG: mercury(II) reductase [Thaumarchaeota archaeon]|nr:mercury(II) reductase [Nitrososphaerota archaeon]
MSSRFDLVILGQGSAAFAAAIKANELKLKTAMVGGNATKGTVIGGTCVNVGCMPSKRLITVGTLFHNGVSNSFQGISYGRGSLDFRKVVQEKNRMVKKFRKEKYADVLKNLENVTYYGADGSFVSRNEVKARDETLRAEKFIIATGARTSIPPIEGADKVNYLTNEEALSLDELPRSLVIIGGRALGLEFAQMFAQFGTEVTVLQRNQRILPDDEPEVSTALTQYLREIGIDIYTNTTIIRVTQKEKRKTVSFVTDGTTSEVNCDQILFATGRTPNTEQLGLDRAGVKVNAGGFIAVNGEMQTSASHVWAAGDVIGEPMLETIAAKEGATAVQNAFTSSKKRINFNEVPSAVFTYPEVARVGLTDAEANGKGIKCACGILPLELVPKAHVIGDTRGVVKLVADRETKVILGVHIVAPHAADLIHEGALAVKNRLTIDDIIDTVHVFPTLSESIKLAAQSFYMDVGKMSCCVE